MESQDGGVTRALDRAKAHNAKLSQRITLLTKKNPEKKRGGKGNVTIQTPEEAKATAAREQLSRPKSTMARQAKGASADAATEDAAGFVYVRKDRQAAKPGINRPTREKKLPAPELIQKVYEEGVSAQILKMRRSARSYWNKLTELETVLQEAKAMELEEDEKIDDEVALIEAQITKMRD